MTAMDLLETIGSIKDQYVLEADSSTNAQKHISIRRTLLIAAVIALTLLLVGCAVVVYARIHMKLVQHNPASTVQTSVEAVGNTGSSKNVLTDCYPQTLPDGYLPGDGAPTNHTTRHISYYNAEGQTIHYSISKNLEPDLVLAPPCEKTSLKVSRWDAELHISTQGAQMLK
ncbi:MAG: hypothetical protein ACI3V1_05570 [Faecousia sp.]